MHLHYFHWLLHCWQYNNSHTHKSYSCFFYQKKRHGIGLKLVWKHFLWEFDIKLVIIYIKIVYLFSGYFNQIICEHKFTQPSTFETVDWALLKFSHTCSLTILNKHTKLDHFTFCGVHCTCMYTSTHHVII